MNGITSSIGDIYEQMGDYKSALNYFFEFRNTIESGPDFSNNEILAWPHSKDQAIMFVDKKIASTYLLGNKADSALFFAKKAHELNLQLHFYLDFTANTLGDVFTKLHQYDSAIKYYRLSHSGGLDNNLGIASIFRNQNIADSCAHFAQSAFEQARSIGHKKSVMKASELLAWAYERNFPDKSIQYYKASLEIRDSLFNQEKISRVGELIYSEQQRKQDLEAAQLKYRNKSRSNGLLSALALFLIAGILLFRNIMHRKKAFAILQEQKKETDQQKIKAESSLEELKKAQTHLVQREKMASLGELTAGIAHEIQNPLNFVNNFSEVNAQLLQEMKQEINKGNYDEAKTMADDVIENEQKINHHGKRAEAIVKGMLLHSRTSSGQKELTDINALAEEYLHLAYHGLRAKDKSFNAKFETDFDVNIGRINVVPQEIGRVILNLINNAFYAVTEKKKQSPDGYDPTVTVSTTKINDKVEIKVKDNGNGIPQKVFDKIFQPFFTTKPAGQGTGLGLSLSYDIVKAHGGELKVETPPAGRAGKENEHTIFIVSLPVS